MCVSPGWASARLDAHVHVHVHDLIPSFESVYGSLAHVSTDGANFNVTVESSSVVVEREYFRALRREYQTRGAVLRHGLDDSPSKPWMKQRELNILMHMARIWAYYYHFGRPPKQSTLYALWAEYNNSQRLGN